MKRIAVSSLIVLFSTMNLFTQNLTSYKGQLHCHSTNSDGKRSPEVVLQMYKDAGYSFVGLSDHNKVTETQQYKIENFISIPNNELSYGYRHVNAINIKKDATGSTETLQGVVDMAINSGAELIMINHPSWSKHTHELVASVNNCNLLEVLMHHYQAEEEGGLEYNLAYDARVWDATLSTGKRVFGTGTDDTHDYEKDFDKSWICVWATTLSTPEIIKSILSGDFYASSGVIINSVDMHNRTLSVYTENGDSIVFSGMDGKTLFGTKAKNASFTLPIGEPYIRATIRTIDGEIGFTQPYFPDDYDKNAVTLEVKKKKGNKIELKVKGGNINSVDNTIEFFEGSELIGKHSSYTKPFIYNTKTKGDKVIKARIVGADGLYYWSNPITVRID